MGKSSNVGSYPNNARNTVRHENPRAVLARDAVDDWDDPYKQDGHYPDGTVCSGCGSVYRNQHWNLDRERGEALLASGAPSVVCPACRKVKSADPSGIITLRGTYWREHLEEIINLIRNEEQRGAQVNPLERIMNIREEGDELIIETTQEKLAQRIGRAVHGAHKGVVDYKWGNTNHLVRVYWERDLEK